MRSLKILIIIATVFVFISCERDASLNEGVGTPVIGDQSATEIVGTDKDPERIALVETVQRELTNRGLQIAEIDGIVGEDTTQALKEFQRQKGLAVTGAINQETVEALGLDSERWKRVITKEYSE